MSDCIFCRIIEGELPCLKVYENQEILAFRDITPVAPVHILVVPKAHIEDLSAITTHNSEIVAAVYEAVANIVRKEPLENGYRVISNVGAFAGQTVKHLHFHIIGGVPLGKMCD